jgi:undecaprenyl-diphosphatase
VSLLNAIILGIVEGLTEFLPISSTAHLLLAAKVLGLSQTDFLKSFEIAIQTGAIFSVVVLCRRSLTFNFQIFKRVIVAFLPTAVGGFLFYKLIKKFLLSSNPSVLWSLLLGGVFIVIFERWYQEKESATEDLSLISYRQAFLIGVFQSVALIPGVSRAAATIYGGLWLGIKRKTIVEFSFLLAVPTMMAATALDLFKSANSFSVNQFGFLSLGFIFSFITAIVCIKWLFRYIQRHDFTLFGIYRIVLSLLFWFCH